MARCTPNTAPRLIARELPGRGRGLCATESIRGGDLVLVSKAFGFVVDIDGGPAAQQALCYGCHRFRAIQPVLCPGCGTTYCSDNCQRADAHFGHRLCCTALARVDTMHRKKASTRVKGMVRFLLRAFARRLAPDVLESEQWPLLNPYGQPWRSIRLSTA